MRTTFPGFIAALVLTALMSFVASQAYAQTADSASQNSSLGKAFDPPVSDQGEAFKSTARQRWQRVDAQYLSKEADPGKFVAQRKTEAEPWDWTSNSTRTISTIVLVILIGLLVWAFARNRMEGGLFRGATQEDRFSDEILREAVGADGDAVLSADISLDHLLAFEDYKQGLRLLLLQALKRAAGDNDIALRRSLTTRDILNRVPQTWNHRPLLAQLVTFAEPVLFGGKQIDRQNYEATLQFAQPILQNKSIR